MLGGGLLLASILCVYGSGQSIPASRLTPLPLVTESLFSRSVTLFLFL